MTDAKAKPKPARPDWRNMDDAPHDGTHVVLSPDGEQETRALWQRTRKIEKGRWVSTGKWVYAWTRSRIAFEPLGWRAAQDEAEALHADVAKAVAEDQARRA